MISSKREYMSCGSYIECKYIIAMSTGIGGPAAGIAVEELAGPG